MTDKNILHMVTPTKHMSPFDVNMAADAGFDVLATYTDATLEEITGLVQDAIFSRPPKLGVRTGFFIGGKDAILALDMLDHARKALVPPFGLSLFADPAGSFTTAAAMVAVVEALLAKTAHLELKGARIAIFGATGVVGFSAGVIAALGGAEVTLVGYDGPDRVKHLAQEIARRFKAEANFADGSSEDKKTQILDGTDIVLAAGKAGVQVLSTAQIASAPSLLIACDVNAVPPSGIEGLSVSSNGEPIGDTKVLGIGALAVGAIKYKTQFGLLKQMTEAKKPVTYDFRDAFEFARDLVS